MFEQIEKYCESQMRVLEVLDSCSAKRTIFDKCFGAFEFAYESTADETARAELINLWEGWHMRLEAFLYA